LRNRYPTVFLFENASVLSHSIWQSPALSSPPSRAFLVGQGYSLSPTADSSRYLIGLNSTEFPLPLIPPIPSLTDFFTAQTFVTYVSGDPALSRFVRCSRSFSPSPSFRRAALSLFSLHFSVFFLYLFFVGRPIVPSLRCVPCAAAHSSMEWRGKDGLMADRRATAVRPVLPGIAISAEVIIRIVDEHILDKHVFGVKPLSSYCPYDERNWTSVVKPVKIGDVVANVVLSPKDPSILYSETWFLSELTFIFLKAVMPRMLGQTTFQGFQDYVRGWIDTWDISAFYCYLLNDGEYELLVSEDRTDNRLVLTNELLNRSKKTRVLTMPQVEVVDGYRLLTVRTAFGDAAFLIVIAIDVDKICIPCVCDFYERFLVIVLSLCYLILIREDREVTFRSFLHMMSTSHVISVIEVERETGETISEYGQMVYDVEERELITHHFADALPVKEAAEYRQLFARLYTEGVGFSQRHFRLIFPGGIFRWFTISGSCEWDPVYAKDVICVLYEDVSNLYRLESQVQQTVSDMALAARLLALHQYSGRMDRVHVTGTEIMCELGYPSTPDPPDLLELMHEQDVPAFRALAEGAAATIRLKGDGDQEKWFWYRAVSTSNIGDIRGFLFSVQELTSLRSNIQITRDCFRVGSVSTSVAAWAIRLDESTDPHLVFETKNYKYLDFLVDPEFLPQVDVSLLRALEEPVTLELKIRMVEVQPYEWHSVTFIPCHPNEVLMVACNIHEQKNTRDLLTQTQETLDLAFTYSDVRLWSFEDTHRKELSVLTISTEFADEIDMDWSTLEHNVTAESQDAVKEAFQKALDGEGELEIEVPFFFDCVHWLLLRGFVVEDEGRRRLIGIHVDLTAIKEAAAELQHQKAAAEDAMKAKSTFLANMTHEIRAPLNGICGLLEVLVGHDLTAEQRDIVESTQDSFIELNELLTDILDLAKLESGRLLPNSTRFDPCEVIFDLDETVFRRHRNGKLLFNIHTEPEQPILYQGDPHCFFRILTALVSNSVKFTPSGRICIHTGHENHCSLALTIRDTGEGMPPSILESLRRHFVRPDTAIIYEDSCVGVGLSMVTEMVRLCHGTITMESTVGAGTTVKILFPWKPILYPWCVRPRNPFPAVMFSCDDYDRSMTLAFAKFYGLNLEAVQDRALLLRRPDAELLMIDIPNCDMAQWVQRIIPSLPPAQIVACLSQIDQPPCSRPVEWFERPLRPHLLRGFFAGRRFGPHGTFHVVEDSPPTNIALHVLAVDDSTMNQLVIKQMLRKLGCSFRIASDGEEALIAVREEHFDVVLLDQNMPVLDGLGAARAIRAMDGDVSEIPIIAMTASNLQEDEALCREAGMDAFLSKPATVRQLGRLLESCRRRRLN
jgi:signal transduction histidine kinase/CheY-like chemotaxis protein